MSDSITVRISVRLLKVKADQSPWWRPMPALQYAGRPRSPSAPLTVHQIHTKEDGCHTTNGVHPILRSESPNIIQGRKLNVGMSVAVFTQNVFWQMGANLFCLWRFIDTPLPMRRGLCHKSDQSMDRK